MKILSKAVIGIMALLSLVCMSCEKLLKVQPPANQINRGLVFEDQQTANAALAGLYAGIRENSIIAGDKLGPILGAYTDELDQHASTTANAIFDIYQNQQIESNSVVYTAWQSTYQQVYAANAILQGVESATKIVSGEKNRLRGETLFLRSLLLFYLQQHFGDIPYPRTTDYLDNGKLVKTPAAQVLRSLEADLRESASLLNDANSNTERIFANKKTAEMLLAKVLMEQRRWADAEVLLQNIIQSGQYSWEADLNKVFVKTGKHVIWQLKPSLDGVPTQEANIYYFGNAAPTGYAISANLYNAFANSDQRKQKWITSVTVGANTWYRAYKYKLTLNNSTEYSIIFRLEEAYLLLAEALANQDKVAQGVPYVNASRQRAGLIALPLTISRPELSDEILEENRREFFAEMGKRFFDLKRAGQLERLKQTKPNWKTFHQLWPLPQKDLLLNPALNPQNLGY